MPRVMTPDERKAFLAGVHVGVLSVAAGDERGPVTVPLWYSYEPGGTVRFQTSPRAVRPSSSRPQAGPVCASRARGRPTVTSPSRDR